MKKKKTILSEYLNKSVNRSHTNKCNNNNNNDDDDDDDECEWMNDTEEKKTCL